MSLLAPLFLAGLGFLAIPIIIHLTQRSQTKVTAFPSLMFLRRIPFRTSSRRRIRHPLLFALRCLALVLLVLAFARPFARASASTEAGGSARDVVVALDVSHSLGYGDRWERAVAEARSVLDGLVPGDRAALVTFSDRADERVRLTDAVEAVRSALGEARPGPRATRFDPALQLAGRILADSDRPDREVVLISDFQRIGWEEGGRTRLPDGVALTAVDLSEPEVSNLTVADVAFETEREGRVRVIARVANMGTDPARDLSVTLALGGRSIGERTADVPPRGTATVAFTGVPLPDRRMRGEVRIARDALEGDDALRFVVTPDEGIDALLLEGSGGRDDRSLFLERALPIGKDPVIRVARRRAAAFERGWLAAAEVVILNDASLSDGGAAAVGDWVREGGGLIVVLGPRTDAARWPAALGALLGGEAGEVVDRAGRGGSRLAWLDYDHPAFELFATPRSGDFSAARFFRFRRFQPFEGTAVLARFEDGEPALVERTEGEGRVLLWMSTLDRFWNDLALQPVYLPFVHRMVRYVSRYRTPERWLPVGRVAELGALLSTHGLDRSDPGGGQEWIVVAPDGDRRSLEIGEEPAWLEFEQAGFYELRPLGEDVAALTVAVNTALEESDLTALAPERLALDAAAARSPEPTAAATGTGDDREISRRELWWPLLILAALVLMTESVLANRWARRRTPSPAA